MLLLLYMESLFYKGSFMHLGNFLNKRLFFMHIDHFNCTGDYFSPLGLFYLHLSYFIVNRIFFYKDFILHLGLFYAHKNFYFHRRSIFAKGITFLHRWSFLCTESFLQVYLFCTGFFAYHSTGYGPLMISNTQFFVLGSDMASPYNLHMYKITFLSTSVDWAKQIACSSGTWGAYYSESVLSSDGSTIYSFFTFGVTKYLYFAGLSVSDGSVATTRFKSSIAVPDLYGSALNGDYVINFKFNTAN